MITHAVFFTLHYASGSAQEQEFFAAARKLAAIPGVQAFRCLKQLSPKNKFDYGLSMEFASQELYDQYTSHPDHTAFVQKHWMNSVADFMEIDYNVL